VGNPVLEMLVRLGFALLLSLCLALVFAWGWDRSDTPPLMDPSRQLSTATSVPPLR
jgi:hypothetical protein